MLTRINILDKVKISLNNEEIGEKNMNDNRNTKVETTVEKMIKEYLKQGRSKLEKDLDKTREAIKIIAADKTRNFIRTMDVGLGKEERDYLNQLIVLGMYQSFCYGYGIGKMEGEKYHIRL